MSRIGGEFIEKEEKEEVMLFGGGELNAKVKSEVQKMAKELHMERPMAWQRADLGAKTTKTTMKGGPSWEWVQARVTADARSGQILSTEKASVITRNVERALLPGGPRDTITVLLYEDGRKKPGAVLDRELCNGWRP